MTVERHEVREARGAPLDAATSGPRHISLALQGGGAHGAFTWGALDRLLEDERIVIEAVSGTSAGAMNAAALAAGYAEGGREGARRALDRFWISASEYAAFSPFQRTLIDRLLGRWNLDHSPGYLWFNLLGRLFSPYQTNPLNHHPLREILAGQIDIEAVRACRALRVFVTATNVRTGRPRVFGQDDLSLDALLASACLPHLYQAVEIDGDPYWDGGYMGNPAIWPLIYGCATADVVLVQINPLVREGVPRTALEIDNRMNEIAFNASLMHEMRAIAFVQRLLEQDALKEPFAARYKNMRIHMIGDEEGMKALGVTSKSNAERGFLEHLKAAGRACAGRWLEATFDDLGIRSSVDVRGTFL
jgi:NTE family protein